MEATAAARCAGAARPPPVNLWALPKESHRGGLEFLVPLAATPPRLQEAWQCLPLAFRSVLFCLNLLANIFTELSLLCPEESGIILYQVSIQKAACVYVAWEPGRPCPTTHIHSISTVYQRSAWVVLDFWFSCP